MPHEIEATATSCAEPDVIFKHLCVAEAWGEWGGFWIRARREADGTEHPNGIGAVRSVPPWREEVVAWDPPRHYGYVALAGPPRRRVLADVTLEPCPAGTLIPGAARSTGSRAPGRSRGRRCAAGSAPTRAGWPGTPSAASRAARPACRASSDGPLLIDRSHEFGGSMRRHIIMLALAAGATGWASPPTCSFRTHRSAGTA